MLHMIMKKKQKNIKKLQLKINLMNYQMEMLLLFKIKDLDVLNYYLNQILLDKKFQEFTN